MGSESMKGTDAAPCEHVPCKNVRRLSRTALRNVGCATLEVEKAVPRSRTRRASSPPTLQAEARGSARGACQRHRHWTSILIPTTTRQTHATQEIGQDSTRHRAS
eukprot:462099-Rhodomonas_salina.1